MTKATSSIVDPGACASSSTLDINDVGRLSITNQPRSSSTSATEERPAPDSPVMTTKSVTPTSVRVASGLLGDQHEESRDRCGRSILQCLREEAGWRGRLEHAPQDQTGVDQRVHVATEWSVDERNEHVLLDLLDRHVFDQVLADTPVLLRRIEDMVVDPP